MTREEKAQEFARNCAEYNNLPIEVEHLIHTAFIAGYNERDDEEKNPWHKVSEELPKDRTLLVTNSVKDVPDFCYYQKNMDRWIVTTTFSVSLTFNDLRKKYTHWMEIPPVD